MHSWLVALLIVVAGSAEAGPLRDLQTHVRTTDPYVRQVVHEAVETSPGFRTLVARLVRSDVVVYLIRGPVTPRLDAHLCFVSAVGGLRYLAIRLSPVLSPRRLVAIIAHELQHAVEIADAPWIVDEQTLAREYERSGVVSSWYGVKLFDSKAAILAGEQVWKEYRGD